MGWSNFGKGLWIGFIWLFTEISTTLLCTRVKPLVRVVKLFCSFFGVVLFSASWSFGIGEGWLWVDNEMVELCWKLYWWKEKGFWRVYTSWGCICRVEFALKIDCVKGQLPCALLGDLMYSLEDFIDWSTVAPSIPPAFDNCCPHAQQSVSPALHYWWGAWPNIWKQLLWPSWYCVSHPVSASLGWVTRLSTYCQQWLQF